MRSVVTERVLAMGDVDAVQVYAPNYFRWMDQGVHRLLAELGHPVSRLLAEGYGTPAVRMACEYFASAGLDDVVECTTAISRVGRSSFDVEHDFRCNGRLLASGTATLVWVKLGETHTPEPVPDWLRAASRAAENQQLTPGLAYSECLACGRVAHPVEPSCLTCGSSTSEHRSSASATLESWTTIAQAPPGFVAPYVLGWARIDEVPVAAMGRLAGSGGDLRNGMPVSVSSGPGGHVALEVGA